MDNQQVTELPDDETELPTDDRLNITLSLPANPDSWFRKRLDLVRSEARKEIQLKSLRPLHEK